MALLIFQGEIGCEGKSAFYLAACRHRKILKILKDICKYRNEHRVDLRVSQKVLKGFFRRSKFHKELYGILKSYLLKSWVREYKEKYGAYQHFNESCQFFVGLRKLNLSSRVETLVFAQIWPVPL